MKIEIDKEKEYRVLNLSWTGNDHHYEHKFNTELYGYIGESSFYKFETVDGKDVPKLISTPNSLYKFFNNNDDNLASLEKGYLYLSDPRKFNDVFDCQVHRNNIPEEQLQRLGVCCFTTKKDNLRMWGNYANSYNGFAIKFRNEDFVDYSDFIHIKCPVSYIKDFENDYRQLYEAVHGLYSLDMSLSAKLWVSEVLTNLFELSAKDLEWSFEEEYRFISLNATGCERKLFFKTDALKEIYIGYRMKTSVPEYYNQLLDITKTVYPQAKIYEVSPNQVVRRLDFNLLTEKTY